MMSISTHRSVAVLAALVATTIVAASCGSTASAAGAPPCLPTLLARGRSYALDPGLAMAITTAITYDHPEVGRLVDVVAEHQAAHPDTGIFDPDASDPDVASLAYVLLVADIADQPGAGNLPLLHRYEDAARAHGMAGIYDVLLHDASDARIIDRQSIPRLVVDQVRAVRGSGMLAASETFHPVAPICGASDEPD
jgi:hypothetical protein